MKKRLMTRDEVRAWSKTDEAKYYVVKPKPTNHLYHEPEYLSYGNDIDGYRKADLRKGYPLQWEKFLVDIPREIAHQPKIYKTMDYQNRTTQDVIYTVEALGLNNYVFASVQEAMVAIVVMMQCKNHKKVMPILDIQFKNICKMLNIKSERF